LSGGFVHQTISLRKKNLTPRLRGGFVLPSDEGKILFSFKGMGANAPIAPKKQKKGGESMEKENDLELLEELEELEEEGTKNAYIEHVNKLHARGREILLRHMYRTAVFEADIAAEDASPLAARILNRNEGSAPSSYFRAYCPECRRTRTLIVVPSRSSVTLKSSCSHVLEKAVRAVRKDRTLTYIGKYRVVPAGLAALLGERILG
jgi:hypothetical protein